MVVTVSPARALGKFIVIFSGLLILVTSDFSGLRGIDEIPTIHRCCSPGLTYENEACVPYSEAEREKSDGGTRMSQADSQNDVSSSHFVSEYWTMPRSLVIPIPPRQNASLFRYRLVNHLPSATCTSGSFMAALRLKSDKREETKNGSGLQFAQLTSRGYLKLGNEYYAPKEFCISQMDTEIVYIRVCNATCKGIVPCIRKCCDLNSVWSLNINNTYDEGCVPVAAEIWNPELYASPWTEATNEERKAIQPHYYIQEPMEWCDVENNVPITNEHYTEDGKRRWSFRIVLDGSIYVRKSRYTWVPDNDIRNFSCFDGGINSRFSSGAASEISYVGSSEHDIMFECAPPRALESDTRRTDFYGGVMAFSCLFLLVTLLVHFLLWEQQTMHGWMRISYCVSLFLMYLFYALNHFGRHTFRRSPAGIGPFCTFIGVGANFFFLYTFSWMTMVNLDLWFNFRKLKTEVKKSGDLKRYLLYASFASIIPIAFTGTAIILDHIYGDDYESGVIIPEYAKTTCTPDPEYAQLIYQYGPAGFLLLFNILFFVGTVFSIYKTQKSTEVARASSTEASIQRSRIVLFTKLLFVMGVPWIFEIISWIEETILEATWYWVLFDLVNLLQGLSIFIIFTCKPSIKSSLELKYPRLKRARKALCWN